MDHWWLAWLRTNWGSLSNGAHLMAPHFLPHPAMAGFEETALAEWGHGQIRDWACSFTDGSRIHVHELATGEYRVHRDTPDPSLSPIHALVHWVKDTELGRAIGVVVAGLGLGLATALLTDRVHS
jgi:hypothetical protein